ncbi:hypothetical protein EJ02DRAFT_419154 [Clathrospora elynae]|uniref:Uncharacterized protein n=1 Tax=Clathrospora elynae TaxID=706981 RepID=A0A6A5T1A1_9PLEO|nr:hypothetical protein EJ02DRAFT_419154 [Clathrospora elynae]
MGYCPSCPPIFSDSYRTLNESSAKINHSITLLPLENYADGSENPKAWSRSSSIYHEFYMYLIEFRGAERVALLPGYDVEELEEFDDLWFGKAPGGLDAQNARFWPSVGMQGKWNEKRFQRACEEYSFLLQMANGTEDGVYVMVGRMIHWYEHGF